MTTTNATPAQALRAALKIAGFNSRRVTVRHDHSTLRVTIRDASAARSKVQAIADQFVSIRRCEATGEILCGGNTFVDVSYTDALVAPAKAAIVALLGPAAHEEIVSLLGDFRAAKVSRQRGATYAEEVRIWVLCRYRHSPHYAGVWIMRSEARAEQSLRRSIAGAQRRHPA